MLLRNPPYYLCFQIQAEGPLEDPRWDCSWKGPQLRLQPVRASLRPKVPPGHPRVGRSRGQEATRLSPVHPQVSQEVRPTKTPQDCTQHPPAQAGVATKVFCYSFLDMLYYFLGMHIFQKAEASSMKMAHTRKEIISMVFHVVFFCVASDFNRPFDGVLTLQS